MNGQDIKMFITVICQTVPHAQTSEKITDNTGLECFR